MERRDKPTSAADHWRSYAGLATAFLAVNQQAEAQVICTDLNPDVVLVNDTLEIDFDMDGITDVAIRHFGPLGWGYAVADGQVYGAPYGTPGTVFWVYASALPSSVLLAYGGSYAWSPPGAYGMLAGPQGMYGPWAGQTAYMGCRFPDPNLPPFFMNDHYAWVYLSVDNTVSSVTVMGYAYEATPFVPIYTGNCSLGAPESDRRSNIQLFPNPVRDLTTVRFGDGMQGQVNVQVLDGIGRVLQQHNTSISAERSMTLDLSALPAGTYFIAVRNNKRVLHRTVTKVE